MSSGESPRLAGEMSRFAVKSLVVVCMATWCSPQLRASCGDYLHTKHGNPPASAKQNSTSPGRQSQESLTSAPGDRQKLAIQSGLADRCPCNGPGCRNDRPAPEHKLPGTLPSVPIPDGIECNASSLCTATEGKPGRTEEEFRPRRGFPLPMKRPPQFHC